MDFGAHLPLMDFGGNPYSLEYLAAYTRAAEGADFAAVSVNDHMVFSVPWLDGPTALAAVLEHTGTMDLATTVALPVIRGPVQVAKAFGAIDRLSGGRVTLAVGPGSSALDYRAVGIDFAERWKRLDEAIGALRSLWRPHDEPFTGDYYSTEDIALSPAPARPGGPPIWIGSWGSDAGLRRTARLGDGWLASAYNTTPADFAEARARLADHLERHDRDPAAFPNALATLWFHITDDTREAEAIYTQRLLPNINRPEEQVRQRLPVGSPERVAELLVAFAGAGVQRVYVWPVVDEISQIQRFAQDVIPLVTAS